MQCISIGATHCSCTDVLWRVSTRNLKPRNRVLRQAHFENLSASQHKKRETAKPLNGVLRLPFDTSAVLSNHMLREQLSTSSPQRS
ncbi:MAG: hypothetical protein J6T63_04605 [Bacteroidales bacterium]|nr:hypothetical protein [Bacteroidales bacterium]